LSTTGKIKTLKTPRREEETISHHNITNKTVVKMRSKIDDLIYRHLKLIKEALTFDITEVAGPISRYSRTATIKIVYLLKGYASLYSSVNFSF
jgi:hypothetical protein